MCETETHAEEPPEVRDARCRRAWSHVSDARRDENRVAACFPLTPSSLTSHVAQQCPSVPRSPRHSTGTLRTTAAEWDANGLAQGMHAYGAASPRDLAAGNP